MTHAPQYSRQKPDQPLLAQEKSRRSYVRCVVNTS
jgi:hypothetical protein